MCVGVLTGTGQGRDGDRHARSSSGGLGGKQAENNGVQEVIRLQMNRKRKHVEHPLLFTTRCATWTQQNDSILRC